MYELEKARQEIAASSESNSKRFGSLVRFVSALVDQTTEAHLTPEEMRYVAAVFKNTVDLFATYEQRR